MVAFEVVRFYNPMWATMTLIFFLCIFYSCRQTWSFMTQWDGTRSLHQKRSKLSRNIKIHLYPSLIEKETEESRAIRLTYFRQLHTSFLLYFWCARLCGACASEVICFSDIPSIYERQSCNCDIPVSIYSIALEQALCGMCRTRCLECRFLFSGTVCRTFFS